MTHRPHDPAAVAEPLEARRLLAVVAGGPVFPDALEPNNTTATAIDLGVDPYVFLDALTVHTATDHDYFRLAPNGDGAARATIAFDPAQGDLALDVFGVGGTLLATSAPSSPSGDEEAVEWAAVGGQAYFVRARGEAGALAPDYSLTFEQPVRADPFEPNGALALATDFGRDPTVDVEGLTLNGPNDLDYYRVAASFPGPLRVDVAFDNDLGDVELQLLSEAGQVLAASETFNDGEAIVLNVAPGVPHYVLVYGFANGLAPDYDLTLRTVVEADSFEPNDTRAAALDLGPITDLVATTPSLHVAGDVDHYRFRPVFDGNLTVAVDFTHAWGDVDAQLLDAAGNVLVESASADDDEAIVFPDASAGDAYVLRVYSPTSDLAPRYGLTFRASSLYQPALITGQADEFESFVGKRITFGEKLDAATVSAADVTVLNLTTGAALPAGAYGVTVENGAQDVVVRLAGVPADGRYRVTLDGAGVRDLDGVAADADADGNAGGAFVAEPFRFLAGDANRDGAVSFLDLGVVAANYGAAGRVFTQGNLDFSAGGAVTFADLVQVAGRYGVSLAPPPPFPARAISGSPFADGTTLADDVLGRN